MNFRTAFRLLRNSKELMDKTKKKVVLFDVGGVIITQPQIGIKRYEQMVGVPKHFLGRVFVNGVPNNAFCRLERGETKLTQFFDEFYKECCEASKEMNIQLPDNFSVTDLFKEMFVDGEIRQEMIDAATTLKNHGYRTAVLTNNYIDDTENGKLGEGFLSKLRQYFDPVMESCKLGLRKPMPEIYIKSCEIMAVLPQEVIFLDDIGVNLKAAAKLGISTVLVRDPITALQELQQLAGVELVSSTHTSQKSQKGMKKDNYSQSKL